MGRPEKRARWNRERIGATFAAEVGNGNEAEELSDFASPATGAGRISLERDASIRLPCNAVQQ